MKMQIHNFENLSGGGEDALKALNTVLVRPAVASENSTSEAVQKIFSQVSLEGDRALIDLTEKFDGVRDSTIGVSIETCRQAFNSLNESAQKALKQAASNIEKFHQAQTPNDLSIDVMEGLKLGKTYRAIDKVGLYAPGGSAPLPSTVLMLGIPAKLAGCSRRILCSPPDRKLGSIHPVTLAAAYVAGVTDVFQIGGAQAIAAMALGTESIPQVSKIFGPGNAYVTAAKQFAQSKGLCAIDMPAGPSEVMVIADDSSRSEFVASDLLGQLEHGPDSQAILVSDSVQVLKDAMTEIQKQAIRLNRKEILDQSLNHIGLIKVSNITECQIVANEYAPEHLLIQTQEPRKVLEGIQNAGSVFLGHYTPESLGDYASGTNHVLPTYGYARSYDGLNLLSFMKSMTYQEATKQGLQNIAETVIELASLEGLDAHANAVAIRFESASDAGEF